jgi:hypothetical protein
MAEIELQLEKIAYLAAHANSVSERRELDELLRESDIEIDAVQPADECATVAA